jgi:hypothetical protein
MLDITKDIQSLTTFRRRSGDLMNLKTAVRMGHRRADQGFR